MFYAIVAGKIWSFITSLSNNDDVNNVPAILMLLVLASPLVMALVKTIKSKRRRQIDTSAATAEVPEQIANYLAMMILSDVLAPFDIIVHSASARIIVKKKESKWQLSVFMAKIEADQEAAMLTCEFDLAFVPLDQERIQLTTIKSLHRCTTETSEIEAKINSILNKFTTVLDYPQMKIAEHESEVERKLYVKFVSVVVLGNGSVEGELKVENGRQCIVTKLSDLTGSICVFKQFQLTSHVKITRNGQTLSLAVSQTGRHELIVNEIKLTVDVVKAIGAKDIDRLETALSE